MAADDPSGDEIPAIRLDDLTKSFGEVQALRGLSFTVQQGEIMGLVGPNGCGKTTAMRILLGLEAPTSGHAYILGEEMPGAQAAVASRIGYMPQNEAMYPDLTVRESLDFFAELQGMEDRAARRTAIEEVLAIVALTERADSILSTLSGGMRRRVSLAAALVHGPMVAILDEPTVGVDPQLRQQMWDHLYARAEAGAAVLVSTHYLGEAEACHRVVFQRAGRLVAIGTPQELLERAQAQDMEGAFRALARTDSDDAQDEPADAPAAPGAGGAS